MTKALVFTGGLAGTWAFGTAAAREKDGKAPRIGLALGSGGATGLAHIPMLEVFDRLNIKPAMIAGSSIGAIMGALYASGLSGADLREMVMKFSGSGFKVFRTLVNNEAGLELMDLLRPDIDRGGILDSRGFLNFLQSKIRVSRFEELEIPLKVVAADYWTGQEVVLNSGEIGPAVWISMAVPGLFAPVQLGERLLVDGGTVNPLPYDLLLHQDLFTVAVDVSGSPPQEREEPEVMDSLFNTFDIMQQAITTQKMKHVQPDIYVRPDVKGIRLLHFHRAQEIFRQAAPDARHLKVRLEKLKSR